MATHNQPLPEGTDQVIDGAGATTRDEFPTPPDNADDVEPAAVGEKAGEDQADADDAAPKSGKASAAAEDIAAAAMHGKGAFFDRIEGVKSQGYDKARDYAVMGKDRATGALDDFIRTINDAAEQIDSKVGGQYGDYARRAAGSIGSFNDSLKGKDVDDLFRDARELVAKAPAIAVGTAAALGFVVARLAKAGLDTDAASTAKDKPAA